MIQKLKTLATTVCLISSIVFAAAPLVGPGLPNLSYQNSEIFKPLDILATVGRGHSSVIMHKGYLAIVYAMDSGEKGGGLSFYDISNPRNAQRVFNLRNTTSEFIREPHQYSVMVKDGKSYVALQAIEGIQFWDWTDINNPIMLKYLKLPGIVMSDYDLGLWWTIWQGEYLYGGGSGNGLYIVKATDPANPVLIKKIPRTETGGFRIGPVYAVGNLLYVTNMNTDEKGMSVLDISNPENPQLLSSCDSLVGYSTLFNGGRIYTIDTRLGVFDVSDPTSINFLGRTDSMSGKGGYGNYQDGYIHMGASLDYRKVDVHGSSGFKSVGFGTSNVPKSDQDFVSVLGNLVFVGNDHESGGSAIMPHQAGKDTLGPEVNMVSPYNGYVNQALTSRIGFTTEDNVDIESLNDSNVVIRPMNIINRNPIKGVFTHTKAIVNFTPEEKLRENTTYEIWVKKGGMKDWSGNPVQKDFKSYFSTGKTIDTSATPLSENKNSKSDLFEFSYYQKTLTFNYIDGKTLKLTAINGKLIFEKNLNSSGTEIINTDTYSSGVYLLILENQNGKLRFKPLYIQ